MPETKLLSLSSQKAGTGQSYNGISIRVPFTSFEKQPRYIKLLEFAGVVNNNLVTAIGAQNNKIPVFVVPLINQNAQVATVGNLALGSSNSQIAAAVQTALNALTFYQADGVTPMTVTWTVSWNAGTAKFTIAATSVFYIVWSGSLYTPATLLGWNETQTVGNGTLTSFTSPVPVPLYASYAMSTNEMNYYLMSQSMAPGSISGQIPLDGVSNAPYVIGTIPIAAATAYKAHDQEPMINIDGSNFIANYLLLTTLDSTVTVDFFLKLSSGMNLVASTTQFWTAKLLFSSS